MTKPSKEYTPRKTLEIICKALDKIQTPAREKACNRFRFLIKIYLQGEPTQEQADDMMNQLQEIIFNTCLDSEE